MGHNMGGAVMIAAMTVMMIVMGGFTLAGLARFVPAAWRARARHAIGRLWSRPAPAGKQGAR